MCCIQEKVCWKSADPKSFRTYKRESVNDRKMDKRKDVISRD